MTVRKADDTSIVLEGNCEVEEAELLLRLLQEAPESTVNWSSCTRLHTAVVQILMAVRPRTVGPCGDPWIERCMSHL